MSLQTKAGYSINDEPLEPQSLFGDSETPDGDVSDSTVNFNVGSDDNLVSGSKVSTLFGKIKYFIQNITTKIANTISASATADSNVGVPSVNVTKTENLDGTVNFAFAFHNIKGATGATGETGAKGAKGDKGDKGDSGAVGTTPNISASASVDSTSGTPACTVTKTGTLTNPQLNFSFTGLKGVQGEQGIQGPQGIQGVQGEQGIQGPAGADGLNGQDGADGIDGITPNCTATANYATTQSGTPSVNVTRTGTDAEPIFNFTFNNIKGDKLDGETEAIGGDTYNGTIKYLNLIKDSIEHTIGVTIADLNSGEDKTYNDTFLTVPAGGNTDDVLKKNSGASGDYSWSPSGGGGTPTGFKQIAHGTLAEDGGTYASVLTLEDDVTSLLDYVDGIWILYLDHAQYNKFSFVMPIFNNTIPGQTVYGGYTTFYGTTLTGDLNSMSMTYELTNNYIRCHTNFNSNGNLKLFALKNS